MAVFLHGLLILHKCQSQFFSLDQTILLLSDVFVLIDSEVRHEEPVSGRLATGWNVGVE